MALCEVIGNMSMLDKVTWRTVSLSLPLKMLEWFIVCNLFSIFSIIGFQKEIVRGLANRMRPRYEPGQIPTLQPQL